MRGGLAAFMGKGKALPWAITGWEGLLPGTGAVMGCCCMGGWGQVAPGRQQRPPQSLIGLDTVVDGTSLLSLTSLMDLCWW